ncbi:MAG TPA: hypothetical protein PKD12_08820 [Nitrospira sp.]|nr:hypothetical protein [Nitrospira sp.]
MKGWFGLIGGLLLGFCSAVLVDRMAPELLAPYTQDLIPTDQMESVKGTVEKKQREANRLLLTLATPKGVLLATFSKKIDDLDLLIAEGYAVTIKLKSYSPFVENPKVERVDASTAQPKSEPPSNLIP